MKNKILLLIISSIVTITSTGFSTTNTNTALGLGGDATATVSGVSATSANLNQNNSSATSFGVGLMTNGGAGGAGGAGGTASSTSSIGDITNKQSQSQDQTQTQANKQQANSSATNGGQNSSQSITQNFEASRVLPITSSTFAQSRDVQLYGQQGGTSNIIGASTQLKNGFLRKNREVVTGDDVRLVIVTSLDIDKYKYDNKQVLGNTVEVWKTLPNSSDIIGTVTLSPSKRGDSVDANTLIYALQKYLDKHYDGLKAVTVTELLSSTYGNNSGGSAWGLSPSLASAFTTNLVANLAGAGTINNANITPEGFVGLSVFIVSKYSIEPQIPVQVEAPKPSNKQVTLPASKIVKHKSSSTIKTGKVTGYIIESK